MVVLQLFKEILLSFYVAHLVYAFEVSSIDNFESYWFIDKLMLGKLDGSKGTLVKYFYDKVIVHS